MPLKKGYSKSTEKKNIKELMTTKPSKTRAKAIATIAKDRGISKAKAKAVQAVAIAKKVQERAAGKKGDKMLSKMSKAVKKHEMKEVKMPKKAYMKHEAKEYKAMKKSKK